MRVDDFDYLCDVDECDLIQGGEIPEALRALKNSLKGNVGRNISEIELVYSFARTSRARARSSGGSSSTTIVRVPVEPDISGRIITGDAGDIV